MKIFGFDFSIAKPAMCYYDIDTKEMEFYCWPQGVDKKTEDILSAANISITNRNLPKMSKNNYPNNNIMVMENTKRAAELSDMISQTVFSLIGSTPMDEVYVCSEGLSFASQGNQTLDLSGYKYSLLTTLWKMGIRNIYTYTPVTIKSTAGVSKGNHYEKGYMIQAIKKTNPSIHLFIETLAHNEDSLKKKTAFVDCVDDLVDAYWVVRTFMERHLKMSLLS